MKNNTAHAISDKTRLAVLMAYHSLTAEDVARITGRSINTVYGWTARSGRQIPDGIIDQIEQAVTDVG